MQYKNNYLEWTARFIKIANNIFSKKGLLLYGSHVLDKSRDRDTVNCRRVLINIINETEKVTYKNMSQVFHLNHSSLIHNIEKKYLIFDYITLDLYNELSDIALTCKNAVIDCNIHVVRVELSINSVDVVKVFISKGWIEDHSTSIINSYLKNEDIDINSLKSFKAKQISYDAYMHIVNILELWS